MPPASTTSDAFSALAEPRRREVLATLIPGGEGGLPVNDIVAALNWPQPQVSKHLAVLRQVGLVTVARRGRQRVYAINGPQLKTIHDWISMYDKFWTHHLDRVKQRAEALARAAEAEAAARSNSKTKPSTRPLHSKEH